MRLVSLKQKEEDSNQALRQAYEFICPLKIAARIADQLEHLHHIKINRWGFYLGNILPDLQHNRIPEDHFSHLPGRPSASGRTDPPEGRPDPCRWNDILHSVNIGMICHFISDYFCHAHTEAFGSSLIRHFVYEAQMMPVSMKMDRTLVNQDWVDSDIGHDWEQNLLRALADHHVKAPSKLRDIQFAIAQGTQLAARLWPALKNRIPFISNYSTDFSQYTAADPAGINQVLPAARLVTLL